MNSDEIKSASEKALKMLEEQRLADEQAKEIVEMMQVPPAEVLTLSDEDFEKMMNVLENPPEPSEKLKEAFRKHSERVVKSYALDDLLFQCDTSQDISAEEAEWMNAEDVGFERWFNSVIHEKLDYEGGKLNGSSRYDTGKETPDDYSQD